MIFKQFYLESLGHASYLVGSEDTGEALALDVRRDVDAYFAEARGQGLRIRYACDTHQHNDYLSGICELPARTEVQLLAGARAELVCWQLLRIGYPLPLGWLAGGMLAWRTVGKPIDILPQWTVRDLRRELHEQSDLLLLDVRQPAEWQAGHIAGALHLTGADSTRRVDDLLASISSQRPIAVIRGRGYRSSVAASVLKARGHPRVAHVLGGMTGWQAEGFETTDPSQ